MNMLSLETLCLNIIVQEFEWFYFLFTSSKDVNLKRSFEFVQMKYSEELLSEFRKKRKLLKEEYLQFLLNRHLKFLEGKWITDITDQFENRFLISVEDIFHRLPNLKRISMVEICCDEILANIAKFCPKITEIEARYSDVSDNGVKYLCKDENGKVPCPELKKLFIESSSVTVEGFKYLFQNLPSLETIDRPNFPIKLSHQHEKDLCKLENARSYNLIDLDLINIHSNEIPYYTDFLKMCLTSCPKLKSIACCISYEEEFKLFTKFDLQKLHFRFYKKYPKININDFLKNKGYNLTSLKVHDCIMHIFDLPDYCPKLKQLYISNVTFLEIKDNSQPIFQCLTECYFQRTKITNSTNKAVQYLLLSSPKLESISFRLCDISSPIDICILECCKSRLIKELTFACILFETGFLKDILLNCPSLKNLNICFSHVRELSEFAKMLPNRPHIDIIKSQPYDTEEDSYFYKENIGNAAGEVTDRFI